MRVTARLDAMRDHLESASAVLAFALCMPLMLPLALLVRNEQRPWVISGHRGRIYADNAAAVHQELVRQGQAVVWISANETVSRDLKAKGLQVLTRNSLAARWAMITAPVLIYSHGESDIDLLQILLRPCLGLRVYVNHCMNHVKAGDYFSPVYDRLRGVKKWAYEFLVTDFDVLLASSESERANFALAFPKKAHVMQLGGGAHMDAFLRLKAEGTRTNDIVYFPTFRDDAAGRRALEDVIQQLLASEVLQQWLETADLHLKIGAHINTGGYAQEGKGRIQWLTPSGIVEAMSSTQAFISDYSGLLADALLLDTPVVFFPFDLDDYLATRRLYHPYERLAFGPMVQSADALIALLVSGAWKDLAPYAAHRQSFRDEIIPDLEPTYAAQTVQAIRKVLAEGVGS